MNKEKNLYKGVKPFISCTDHSVSQESYELLFNEEFEMMVTLPVPLDLEKYYKSEDYISHTDASKTIVDKIYQRVRKHTLQKKLALINSFHSTEKKLLDIGSGTGDFLATCKKDHWSVFGVEPNENAIAISKTKGISVVSDISI